MALSREMSEQQAFEVVQTLLDAPESRFPLTFNSDLPRIRELFHAGDPQPMGPQDGRGLGPAQAGRLHGGAALCRATLLEPPRLERIRRHLGKPIASAAVRRGKPSLGHAALLHHPLAGGSAACRGVPRDGGEARGYIEKPVQQLFEGSVATHGVRRATRISDVPLEGIIAALVCPAEDIAVDVFKHLDDVTRRSAAGVIVRFIMRDESRHCAFGWYFLEAICETLTPEQKKMIEDSVITMMEKVELNGYHSSWLAPENPASIQEVEADRITYEAGLGSTIEEAEKPIFITTLQRIRNQMQPLGINLPPFFHPKLGTI